MAYEDSGAAVMAGSGTPLVREAFTAVLEREFESGLGAFSDGPPAQALSDSPSAHAFGDGPGGQMFSDGPGGQMFSDGPKLQAFSDGPPAS